MRFCNKVIKRTKLEIYNTILSFIASNDGVITTKILYKSNLSHMMLVTYIDDMVNNNLIYNENISGKKKYFITSKGLSLISDLRELRIVHNKINTDYNVSLFNYNW